MANNDALIKQIGEVVDQKIVARLKPIEECLDGIDKRLDGMDKRFDGIDKRLDGMDKRFDDVEKRLGNLEKEQKKQGKELKKIKNTLDIVIDHFDRSTASNTQRIKRIEEHLHL